MMPRVTAVKLAYLRALSGKPRGQWYRVAELVPVIGKPNCQVLDTVRRLVKAGWVEHADNGTTMHGQSSVRLTGEGRRARDTVTSPPPASAHPQSQR